MTQKSEFQLPYRIFSTPTLWRPRPGAPWMIALVAGEMEPKRGSTTSVDVVQPDGRRVSRFPVLRQNPPLVAPANQTAAVDVDGDGTVELVVVDFEGRTHVFKADGKPVSRAPASNPVHGLLSSPPQRVELPGAGTSLLLVSRDAQPGARSRHAVDLIGTDGPSRPGFPVALPSVAEQRPPIVDLRSGRVFVLLENGQVEALQLADGRRPAGFPAGKPAPEVTAGTRHMALAGTANALYVSTGGPALQRIDIANGSVRQVLVSGAQRLTGLAGAGDQLYAYDEAAARLVSLDANGKLLAQLALSLPPGSKCYSLQAAPARGAKATVLLVTSPQGGSEVLVDQLFDQHATPAVRQEIKQLADEESMSRYGTLKLDDAQRKEENERITQMKRGYLETKLGAFEAARRIAGPTVTNLNAVADKGAGLQLLVQDEIKDFTPETGFMLASVVRPELSIDPASNAATWIVPVNISERAGGGKSPNRSLIRIYQLPN